jgi:hypothetical protein
MKSRELQPEREILELARVEDSEAAEHDVHDGAVGLCVEPPQAPRVLPQQLPDGLAQLRVGGERADGEDFFKASETLSFIKKGTRVIT